MENQGTIAFSKSAWPFSLVVVKEMDRSLRLCIDYRRLNSLSEVDLLPLFSIEELLVKVSSSVYFSCVYRKSGYHQVHLDEATKHKTAFCAGDRLYEYSRLPFGLKKATSHFCRLMAVVLNKLINTSVPVYLNGLIILGSTPEEHADNLIEMLDVLSRHKQKINLKNCSFFQESVECFGHIVNKEGIRSVF